MSQRCQQQMSFDYLIMLTRRTGSPDGGTNFMVFQSPPASVSLLENRRASRQEARQLRGKKHGQQVDASRVGPSGPCRAISKNRATKPDTDAALRIPSNGCHENQYW